MCKSKKWVVYQYGASITTFDAISDIIIAFTASIVIQLIPIWILTLIMFSIQDVPMRIGSFIENMLVYNIVVCSGNVIATKNKENRGRFLAVLIIIAASIAFFGEYMSSSAMGGLGFKIEDFRYIFITTSVFMFTSLLQYFETVEDYIEKRKKTDEN